MKLLRDVFRLRASRGPFGAQRDARVREFVVTVPAPLTGAALGASAAPAAPVAATGSLPHASARAA